MQDEEGMVRWEYSFYREGGSPVVPHDLFEKVQEILEKIRGEYLNRKRTEVSIFCLGYFKKLTVHCLLVLQQRTQRLDIMKIGKITI